MEKNKISPLMIGIFVVVCAVIALLIYFGSMKKTNDTAISTPTPSASPLAMQTATFKTSMGDIEVQFFSDKAPKTVQNFISLAQKGFYDGTKFHRVIKDFMIQGGDPLSKEADTSVYGTGGPGYAFADEINDVPLVQGILAMANSGPDTNGSQFFIITAPATPWLQGHHTAFGKVIKGLDIVLKIGATKTGPGDQPVIPVVVNQVIIGN